MWTEASVSDMFSFTYSNIDCINLFTAKTTLWKVANRYSRSIHLNKEAVICCKWKRLMNGSQTVGGISERLSALMSLLPDDTHFIKITNKRWLGTE